MWMWCLPLMFFACDSVCYIHTYSCLSFNFALCVRLKEKSSATLHPLLFYFRDSVFLVKTLRGFTPVTSSSRVYKMYSFRSKVQNAESQQM
jgi:hypothetical protein